MCVLLLLCEVVYIDTNYIQLTDDAVEFNNVLPDFLPVDLSISDRGMLQSPTIRVDSSISPSTSINFCIPYFDALLLGAYTYSKD